MGNTDWRGMGGRGSQKESWFSRGLKGRGQQAKLGWGHRPWFEQRLWWGCHRDADHVFVLEVPFGSRILLYQFYNEERKLCTHHLFGCIHLFPSPSVLETASASI